MIDEPKGEIDNQQITPQYMAGLWDGEGTFSITRSKAGRYGNYVQLRAQVMMTNTDLRLIYAAKKYVQSLGCRFHIRPVPIKKKNRKPQYEIKITKMVDRIIFAKSLIPFLIGKKSQAELLVEFLESRLSKISLKRDFRGRYKGREGFSFQEKQIYEAVKSMNKRGISETTSQPPNGDDIVRPTLRDVEQGRNDLAVQQRLFS